MSQQKPHWSNLFQLWEIRPSTLPPQTLAAVIESIKTPTELKAYHEALTLDLSSRTPFLRDAATWRSFMVFLGGGLLVGFVASLWPLVTKQLDLTAKNSELELKLLATQNKLEIQPLKEQKDQLQKELLKLDQDATRAKTDISKKEMELKELKKAEVEFKRQIDDLNKKTGQADVFLGTIREISSKLDGEIASAGPSLLPLRSMIETILRQKPISEVSDGELQKEIERGRLTGTAWVTDNKDFVWEVARGLERLQRRGDLQGEPHDLELFFGSDAFLIVRVGVISPRPQELPLVVVTVEGTWAIQETHIQVNISGGSLEVLIPRASVSLDFFGRDGRYGPARLTGNLFHGPRAAFKRRIIDGKPNR